MSRMVFRCCFPLVPGLLLMASVASAPAQSSGSAEGIDLRPIWEEGQRSRYRITQTERTEDRIPQVDRTRETTTEFRVEATWRVLDAAEEGGGTAELVLDEMRMTTTGPSGKSRTITENQGGKGTEPMQRWIGAMTGNPLEVEVGPDGSIEGVSGYEAIQREAGPMGEQLDEAYFREIAMNLAVMYCGGAGGAAEPGDEWSQSYTGGHQMGKIEYNTDYTLKGTERIEGIRVALVNRSSDLSFEPEIPDSARDSVELRLTESRQSGQVMFDLSRHEVVGAHGEQMLKLEMTRSAGGRSLTIHRRETTDSQILRISEE